jgi:hypothetical protein
MPRTLEGFQGGSRCDTDRANRSNKAESPSGHGVLAQNARPVPHTGTRVCSRASGPR